MINEELFWWQAHNTCPSRLMPRGIPLGNSIGQGGPVRLSSIVWLLILERDLDLDPVGAHFAVFDLHIELGDLGDAEVAQGFRRSLDGGCGGLFPRLGAGSDQLDDFIDALGHVALLSDGRGKNAASCCSVGSDV